MNYATVVLTIRHHLVISFLALSVLLLIESHILNAINVHQVSAQTVNYNYRSLSPYKPHNYMLHGPRLQSTDKPIQGPIPGTQTSLP